MPEPNKNNIAEWIYRVRHGETHGPLLVALHGLGGDEHVMNVFDRALPAAGTVIAPRAPIAIEPGMFPGSVNGGYSWLRSTSAPDRSSLNDALDRLRRFITLMLDRYALDRDRVYLMGFSQGAAISYALSLIEPTLIAGVIALAGFLPEEMHSERNEVKLTSAPRLRASASAGEGAFPRHGYLIIHGIDDQIVPILRAHQARDHLQALGAPVEYHAYPIGHKVAPQGMRDIHTWLQTRIGVRSQDSE